VKYVEAYGVSAFLTSSNEVTLFAPSNQAFVNLLTTTPGFPEDITSISPSTIAGVLAYHMVAGTQLSTALTSGAEFDTYFEQPDFCDPSAEGEVQIITVNNDGTLLTGSTNDAIEVDPVDLRAENGVVHIVESVMIPPSVGETLTPILTTVAAPAFLSADFSLTAALITYADCAHETVPANNDYDVAEILANPAANYTVFMVPDALMEAAGYGDTITEVLTYLATQHGLTTAAHIRGLLLGHVSSTEYTGAQLAAAETEPFNITALTGGQISVSHHPELDVILLNGGQAVLGLPDADIRDNGRVHVITKFLFAE
jgi:hypothetical protein